MVTIIDVERGYNERMAGFYDKWYRYNRKDEGAEYDKGVVLATNSTECKNECVIIECN
jgi:hypothetical protein